MQLLFRKKKFHLLLMFQVVCFFYEIMFCIRLGNQADAVSFIDEFFKRIVKWDYHHFFVFRISKDLD